MNDFSRTGFSLLLFCMTGKIKSNRLKPILLKPKGAN